MSLKLLYIDDEPDLCDIFKDYFSSKEVEVSVFTDPAQALAASAKNRSDLVFIDYRLPGITGDEVAQSMPKDIPKYLVTGDISIKTEFNFAGVFTKPYPIEEIQQVIDRFLKIKSTG